MSADNWAICPKCYTEAYTRHGDNVLELSTAYGVLDKDDYETLKEEVEAGVDEYKYQTFREDYDIGIEEDGVVRVNYRGSCTTCKVRVELKTESLPIVA